MKRRVGTLQELLEQATEEIEKLTPERQEELRQGIREELEKRSQEREAVLDAAAHPCEYTALHADLAVYFNDSVRSTRYWKLEERFLLCVKEKKTKGMSLDSKEQNLLDRIKFCWKCGTKNPKGSRFCFSCGQKMVDRPVHLLSGEF